MTVTRKFASPQPAWTSGVSFVPGALKVRRADSGRTVWAKDQSCKGRLTETNGRASKAKSYPQNGTIGFDPGPNGCGCAPRLMETKDSIESSKYGRPKRKLVTPKWLARRKHGRSSAAQCPGGLILTHTPVHMVRRLQPFQGSTSQPLGSTPGSHDVEVVK